LYSNSFSPQKKENKMNFTNFKEVFCSLIINHCSLIIVH